MFQKITVWKKYLFFTLLLFLIVEVELCASKSRGRGRISSHRSHHSFHNNHHSTHENHHFSYPDHHSTNQNHHLPNQEHHVPNQEHHLPNQEHHFPTQDKTNDYKLSAPIIVPIHHHHHHRHNNRHNNNKTTERAHESTTSTTTTKSTTIDSDMESSGEKQATSSLHSYRQFLKNIRKKSNHSTTDQQSLHSAIDFNDKNFDDLLATLDQLTLHSRFKRDTSKILSTIYRKPLFGKVDRPKKSLK